MNQSNIAIVFGPNVISENVYPNDSERIANMNSEGLIFEALLYAESLYGEGFFRDE